MTNGYEQFGKYLVSHLELDLPDELDWGFIVREYNRTNKKNRKPGLMWINWTVCTHFGVDPSDVKSKRSRKRLQIIPRHTAQYLAATLFGYTQIEISEFYNIGNRSLITNNNQNVEGLLATDKFYKTDVETITNKLLGYDENERSLSDSIGIPDGVQKPEIKERDSVPLDGNRKVESSN